MNVFRIALANIRFPPTAEESIAVATQAIRDSGRAEAGIVCFPECFVPGYRGLGTTVEPSNPVFLERAWSAITQTAAEARIAVILGTERSTLLWWTQDQVRHAGCRDRRYRQ